MSMNYRLEIWRAQTHPCVLDGFQCVRSAYLAISIDYGMHLALKLIHCDIEQEKIEID
jgi:hypothetical protein